MMVTNNVSSLIDFFAVTNFYSDNNKFAFLNSTNHSIIADTISIKTFAISRHLKGCFFWILTFYNTFKKMQDANLNRFFEFSKLSIGGLVKDKRPLIIQCHTAVSFLLKKILFSQIEDNLRRKQEHLRNLLLHLEIFQELFSQKSFWSDGFFRQEKRVDFLTLEVIELQSRGTYV